MNASNCFQIDKLPYCNNNPSEATPNSIGPNEYRKEIGSQENLDCKNGYAPQPEATIQATCEYEGKWKTASTCAGQELLTFIGSDEMRIEY